MNCHLVTIKKIERCPVAALADTEQVFNQGILLKEYNDFEKIDIIGLASVETKDKIEGKQRIYITKVVFKMASIPEVGIDNYCYRLTSVTGTQFILGTKARPYTLLNSTDARPDSPAEKTGCTCTITYTNLFSLLSVLD